MTVAAGEELAAGTVTWLAQASFAPPLLMVGVRADSRLHELVARRGAFAINVPAGHQKDVASAFFRPSQVQPGTINGYAYEPGPETGAPLLRDLPAWLEARVTDQVRRGDHTVFVAEVINAGLRHPDAAPLRLSDTHWSYGG